MIVRCVAACSEALEVPGLFVPVEDELGEADQCVSLGGRVQTADLTRGLVAVALGEEIRLLHTVTLRDKISTHCNLYVITPQCSLVKYCILIGQKMQL